MEGSWMYSASLTASTQPNYTSNGYPSTQYHSWNNNPSVLVPSYPPPSHLSMPPPPLTYPPPSANAHNYLPDYRCCNSYYQSYSATNNGFYNGYSNNIHQNCNSYSSYSCPPPGYGYDNYHDYLTSAYQYTSDCSKPSHNYSTRSEPAVYNYKDELESYKTLKDSCNSTLKRDAELDTYEHKYNYNQRCDNYKKYLPDRSINRSNNRRRSLSKSPPRRKCRSETRDKSSRKHCTHPVNKTVVDKIKSERDLILSKWRRNYCSTREEVCHRIKELSKVNQDEILEKEKNIWTRTTPADLYYEKDEINPKVSNATAKLLKICETFKETLVLRTQKVNATKPKYEPPPRKNRARLCKHKCKNNIMAILYTCLL